MPTRYRRAKPQDISKARILLEPDRSLFSAAAWRLLPRLLEDLFRRDKILLCVLEQIETNEIVFVGASGFLHADFLAHTIEGAKGILNAVFSAAMQGRDPFLNYKQLADAHRRDDLRLLNFFGVPPGVDLDDPNSLAILGNIIEAWNFFHRGFRIRELWFESAVPLMIHLQLRIGFRVYTERELMDGQTAKLLCLTREQAAESTPLWPGSAMFSPRARFGFTRAEQKLLELALLDHSDREAASELVVSTEAVKKRWRSIYSKILRVDPALLRELNGADRRRALLQSLRNNLQELRPF